MSQVHLKIESYNKDEFDIEKWHQNIQQALTRMGSKQTPKEYLSEQINIVYHPEEQTTDKIFVMEYSFDD